MDKETISRIYEHLGDNISKKIFSNRLLYSLTEDRKYIRQMLRELPESRNFYNRETEKALCLNGAVIFGAGSWGKEIYLTASNYPWKCFIDSAPETNDFKGLPVVPYSDFIENYHDETIVISSRLYYQEMYTRLIENGILPEKIINIGYMLDRWSKKQYFDLEVLRPEEEEIFIDAGSLDGATSIEFVNWCKKSKKKSVYVFEPDKENAQKCHKNLIKHNIKCEIIPKGCWEKEDILRFQAQGNGNSAVSLTGEDFVEVTSIDKELYGKRVTFIKMDIEGAEKEALYGAKETIIRNQPKLAICIYHKPEDVWEIPSIILQYYSGYKFYLRHYSLTDSETVLYALP